MSEKAGRQVCGQARNHARSGDVVVELFRSVGTMTMKRKRGTRNAPAPRQAFGQQEGSLSGKQEALLLAQDGKSHGFGWVWDGLGFRGYGISVKGCN